MYCVAQMELCTVLRRWSYVAMAAPELSATQYTHTRARTHTHTHHSYHHPFVYVHLLVCAHGRLS